MIPKMIRLALVLLAVLVTALEFPKIYKKTFEQRERRTQLVFSEILNDFVTLKYEYDTVQLREIQIGRDRAGNTYDTKALMDIFPMRNCRQLMYENRFPDTIRGQHVTLQMIQDAARFPLFLGAGPGRKSLLWMFESHTDQIKMELPEDMFRLTDEGIEFIETDINRVKGVNKEKSERFTQAMKNEGIQFPIKNIYGLPSTSKSKDDGYFMVDNKDDFFHLKMYDGEPQCHKIPLPVGMQVNGMNCLVDDVNYGYVYDQNYNIYLMRIKDYSFFQLPIYDYKDYGSLITMSEDLFFYTYQLYGLDRVKIYVVDKEHNLLASETLVYPLYENSKVGQRENYVFPFKARFTRDGAKKLKVEAYDMQRFICLNIALTLLLLCIKLYHRRSMRNLFNYLDLVVTLACGIYGFIAVLIFPNRK